MSTPLATQRGRSWLRHLTHQDGQCADGSRAVIFADAPLGSASARYIAVVDDPTNKFPRARNGEVGLEQGWALAALVRKTVDEHRGDDRDRRPIVAVVDVAGQAYGRREELMGIHIACAAAADAYAQARLAGHPVLALIVGHAMSGAFLAHGYQANRIVALDAPGVLIHAMGQAAAARITRRSVEQLVELGNRITPMSYEMHNFAKLGLLESLIAGIDADAPDTAAVDRVRAVLADALASVAADPSRDLSARYRSPAAVASRAAAIEVRRQLALQW